MSRTVRFFLSALLFTCFVGSIDSRSDETGKGGQLPANMPQRPALDRPGPDDQFPGETQFEPWTGDFRGDKTGTAKQPSRILVDGICSETISESEPNDSRPSADPISYQDLVLMATIGEAGDEDYFSFSGTAGDSVCIEVIAQRLNPASDLDAYLVLYNGSGTKLAENDDYFDLDPGAAWCGWDPYIKYCLPSSGTYCVKVLDRCYVPGGGCDPEGGTSYFYDLRLYEVSSEDEPNNDCATAKQISYGDCVRYAAINPAGDRDYFAFEGTAGDSLFIEIIASRLDPPSNLDSYIYLYDVDGTTVLAENDDCFGGTDSWISYYGLPSTGTYCIRVEDLCNVDGCGPVGGGAYYYDGEECGLSFTDLGGDCYFYNLGLYETNPYGIISGTVTRQDNGEPIANTRVFAYDSGWNDVQGEAFTDATGHYSIVGLENGLYYVQAVGSVYDSTKLYWDFLYFPEYYNQSTNQAGADLVHVSSEVTGIDFTLETGIVMSGKITREDGMTPISGAEFYIWNSGWTFKAWGYTLSDGTFARGGLAPGSYYVGATGRVLDTWNYEYCPEYFRESPDKAGAHLLALSDDTTGIDFTLRKAGGISGTVKLQIEGTAVAYAELDIWDSNWIALAGLHLTDSDGRYSINGLCAGPHYVAATGWIYPPVGSEYSIGPIEYYSESPSRTGADLVVVGDENDVQGVDFTLAKWGTGQIGGTVKFQDDDSPIDKAKVFLYDRNWNSIKQTNTGTNGYYFFAALSDDSYYVEANGDVWHVGFVYQGEYYEESHDKAEADLVVVTDGEAVSGIDFTLVKRTGLCGDVNDDFSCNSTDALVVLSYDVGLPVPAAMEDKIDQGCADVNKDGSSNSTDALIILSNDVGLPVPYCVCECGCPCPGEPDAMVAVVAGAKARGLPSSNIATKGDRISVPVLIDVSQTGERLGSFTGSLQWDPVVLRFAGCACGKGARIEEPLLNKSNVSEGRLDFSNAIVDGAEGTVNVLNVEFEAVGHENTVSSINLTFEAMTAAGTFSDLLTGLKIESTLITVQGLPTSFALEQNYPNPFNPATSIQFAVGSGQFAVHTTLTVYNLLGQEVATLVDEPKEPGCYTVTWDASDLPSGIYFYRLEARGTSRGNRGEFTETRRMALIK